MLRLLANCSAPPIERARLRRLAMFDDTTMAFNHRYLTPRLVEEMERASRSSGDVSVLYMDLDHFKSVNDNHGHAVGDVVLRMFADRVRKVVRRIDVLVRRGGEEFVLIMPATGATQAHATGHRIQQTLAFGADRGRRRTSGSGRRSRSASRPGTSARRPTSSNAARTRRCTRPSGSGETAWWWPHRATLSDREGRTRRGPADRPHGLAHRRARHLGRLDERAVLNREPLPDASC